MKRDWLNTKKTIAPIATVVWSITVLFVAFKLKRSSFTRKSAFVLSGGVNDDGL